MYNHFSFHSFHPNNIQKATKGKKGGKKSLVKYTIDCWQPVDDKVLDMATFEKFFKDRIKVKITVSFPPFIIIMVID